MGTEFPVPGPGFEPPCMCLDGAEPGHQCARLAELRANLHNPAWRFAKQIWVDHTTGQSYVDYRGGASAPPGYDPDTWTFWSADPPPAPLSWRRRLRWWWTTWRWAHRPHIHLGPCEREEP